MKIERDTKVSDAIPTSTMADIAFLLIIYFMVTTTFTATRGLDFGLPKDDDTPREIEREDSVHIHVQPVGLVVDGKPMQLEDVLDYLKPRLERNPMKPVIVQTDPQAPYGNMVSVLDELRQGEEKIGIEIKNISIPTRREIESFWY
ncbi:MAG TPA: biopolymer transporter ExbD [Thermoanaerobaculia bacterium]|nr:biopolymer transporter ExbD [Thermoanaerobaculia bacterium]